MTATSAPPLCWICNSYPADSGEHKHKRSDLLAAFGKPSQAKPLYYHDFTRANHLVGSLDAKILHAPVRICKECNNARTQPHDKAWERMSEALRGYDLKVGQWLRPARVFPYRARRHMIGVHLYFLKLFGCMLEEAKASGRDFGIDIRPFSEAIMTGTPHPGVLLRFGNCDGVIGRSDLFRGYGPTGDIYASWLYQAENICVAVTYAPPTLWHATVPHWHPNSPRFSRRLLIADFRFREQYEIQEARTRIVRSIAFRGSGK